MNKKFFYSILITILTVPAQSFSDPRYISLAAKTYATVTRHPVFTACKRATARMLKVGAVYLLAHFINAHRNKNRQATIEYDPDYKAPDKTKKGKLTVTTDGLVTVEGGAHKFSIATERILLGRKRHAASWSEQLQHFIKWITLPADRNMTRHIIHVPENTDISINTRYSYAQSSIPNPIIVRGISGIVETTTPHGTTRYRGRVSGAILDA